MASLAKIPQYPLAFIAGELAYFAAGFIAVALPLNNLLPYPSTNFNGPIYAWWAYDAFGFIDVYYRMAFYGIFFGLFCLGMQTLYKNSLSGRRVILVSAVMIVLITITIHAGLSFELNPVYRYSPSARSIIDAVTFGLIGGWFVLAWRFVRHRSS
jgi:hypothetical protein